MLLVLSRGVVEARRSAAADPKPGHPPHPCGQGVRVRSTGALPLPITRRLANPSVIQVPTRSLIHAPTVRCRSPPKSSKQSAVAARRRPQTWARPALAFAVGLRLATLITESVGMPVPEVAKHKGISTNLDPL